jgi:hypothetical protein
MKKRRLDALLEELRTLAKNSTGQADVEADRRSGEIIAELEKASRISLGEKLVGLENSFDHLFGHKRGEAPDGMSWADWVYRDTAVIAGMLETDARGNIL